MIAHTIIAVSLISIAPLHGCGSSVVCNVKIPAGTDTQARAKTRGNAALSLLVEGKQQEANKCAELALQDANALHHMSPDVDRRNFVDTITFVKWLAEHWNWKQGLNGQFEFVSRLSNPARIEDAEIERAVDMVMIGLNAMAHFDRGDEIRKYTELLEHGRKLIDSWKDKPETSVHYQMYILFYATVNAWPDVRAKKMGEVRPWCEKLNAVKNWHPDLQEDAQRAKTACAQWFGDSK